MNCENLRNLWRKCSKYFSFKSEDDVAFDIVDVLGKRPTMILLFLMMLNGVVDNIVVSGESCWEHAVEAGFEP